MLFLKVLLSSSTLYQNENSPWSHLHTHFTESTVLADQANMSFELEFEGIGGNKGVEDELLRLSYPCQVDTWWWHHRGYQTGKGRSHLWSHIEGKQVSPLKGLYLPTSHYTTPRALTGMGLGLSCAGNSNAVKSQLKPTHKSHLMLPWWVESNMPDLLIICQTLGSQPPSSKI